MNAEIPTCVIAARPWKGHIVIVLDQFLIVPCGRRNTSLTQTHQWKGSLTR